MGRVKKIAAPMNFGPENRKLPSHLNVSLLASNQQVVKANSLVLSYNSKTLKELLGSDEVVDEVNTTEYPKYVIDKFVTTLYTGNIDFDRIPYTRHIWELADRFRVKWLLKKFDSYLVDLISEFMKRPKFSQLRYIFEESYYLMIRKRRFEFLNMATRRLNTGRNRVKVKRNFLKRYISRDMSLSTNQINLVVEFAGKNDCDVLLHIVLKKVQRRNFYYMDMSSRRIIRQIDLPQCLRRDMVTFIKIFGNKARYSNLSGADVEELRQLEANSKIAVFSQRPELRLRYLQKQQQLVERGLIASVPELRGPINRHEAPSTNSASRSELRVSVRIVNPPSVYRPRVVNMGVPRPRPDLVFGDDLEEAPDDITLQEFLNGTNRIPNITFSYPEAMKTFLRSLRPVYSSNIFWGRSSQYRLQDVITFFKESNFSFRNMYMFIELIFVRKDFSIFSDSVTESDLARYIEDFIEIKNRHAWRKINSTFVSDIVWKLSDGPMKNLLQIVGENNDLASPIAASSSVAAEIISARGAGASLRSRKHYNHNPIRMGEFKYGGIKKYAFRWTHPDMTDCSLLGTCGFVLCVVPISHQFEIRLSTRPEDYTSDIHCHPELLDASNMHLVLRRDFSTKGKSVYQARCDKHLHISWHDRPVYAKNHVFWCGEDIPDLGYIALIIYYSFTRGDEDERLEAEPIVVDEDQFDSDDF